MTEEFANTIIFILFGVILCLVQASYLFFLVTQDKKPNVSKLIAGFVFFALILIIIGSLILLTTLDILEMNWPVFLISYFSAGFTLVFFLFIIGGITGKKIL